MNTDASHLGTGATCALALLLMGCPGGKPKSVNAPLPWRNDTVELSKGELEHAFLFHDGAGPCQDPPNGLSALCQRILPSDGRIWFEAEDGSDRWCDCAKALGYSTWANDSLVAFERMVIVKTFMDRRERLQWSKEKRERRRLKKASIPSGPDSATRLPLARLSLLPDPCPPGCHSNREALELLGALFFEAYPIFKVKVDECGESDYPWGQFAETARVSWPGYGELPDALKMEIWFNAGFLEDPEVHWEFIAFMLAHEIGHALGKFENCYVDPASGVGNGGVSENNCDHWASAEALRKVFPNDMGLRVSRRAEKQLVNYETTFGTQDCGWGKPCPLVGCEAWGFPPAACRALTMKAGRRLSAALPSCVSGWTTRQPATCEVNANCP